jgi:hypothetical protein
MNRIKSFLAVLGLVSAVSVNAGAYSLSVNAASGNPYGYNSVPNSFFYGTGGAVQIPAHMTWQINIPISTNSSYSDPYIRLGGVWSGVSSASGYLYSATTGYVSGISLTSCSGNSCNDPGMWMTDINQTVMIQLTAGSTTATANSARAHDQ